MGTCHRKITCKEREEIFGLAKQGYTIRGIARCLGRSPSSISEELRRKGMNITTYTLSEAQVDRNIKASYKGRKRKLIEGNHLTKLIRQWIQEKRWSPEQVSGRLKIKYKRNPEKHLSHESIYKYIYNIEDPEEREKYIKSLRRKRKQRKSRKSTKRRGPISNPTSIHERPLEVNSREIAGHWEGDSIVGKEHKSAVGTLVERSSRYTIIVKYEDKSAENVAKAFAKAYESIPNGLKKSLTFDRGAEMAQHALFTQLTGIRVYFADPGSPGQRGTNENTNGLIRQFFPKKTDFSRVSEEELKAVEDLLNERPRRTLGFKTPKEVLDSRKKGPEPPITKHRFLSEEEAAVTLSLGQ
jgi:transposase, IS30 family